MSKETINEKLNEIVKNAKTEFSLCELEEISLYAIQTADGTYGNKADLHESDTNHVRNEMKESDDIRENIKRVVILRLLKNCGLYSEFIKK